MFENEESYGEEVMVGLVAGIASDDTVHQFVELSRLLVSVNYTAHLDAFDLLETMVDGDAVDGATIVIEVDTILREAVRLSVNECGVWYDPEIDMAMLIDLARAILDFNTTENPDRLIDVIEMSEDVDEAFERVLSELTGREHEEWTMVIERVMPEVIERIKSLAADAAGRVNVTLEQDYQFAKRLDKLKGVEKPLDVHVSDLTHAPSLESMYMLHLPSLINQEPRVVVDSMYSLACVACKSFEEVEEHVSLMIEDFCDTELERIKFDNERKYLYHKYAYVYEEKPE